MRLPLFSSHRSWICSRPHFRYCSFSQILTSTEATTDSGFSSVSLPRMNGTAGHVSSCHYHRNRRRRDQKVLVIMGATGTGKSRLSVDIATRFFPCSEIINSDKMQMYRGLDITTNKISTDERRGVPHHLLGHFDPVQGEVNPVQFRYLGASVIDEIASRRKLPVIVGGSNSFIHSLVVDSFCPDSDPFQQSSSPLRSISSEMRYKCCFLWVDVSFPVLSEYLSKRVDDMLDLGMVEELAQFYDPEADDLDRESEKRIGLRKAIGVPEFDRYFKEYPPPEGLQEVGKGRTEEDRDDLRRRAYEAAVRSIKENTCRLAKRQLRKIHRLRMAGWDLHRVDASEFFKAAVATSSNRSGGEEIWEKEVLEPSVKIVKGFLNE